DLRWRIDRARSVAMHRGDRRVRFLPIESHQRQALAARCGRREPAVESRKQVRARGVRVPIVRAVQRLSVENARGVDSVDDETMRQQVGRRQLVQAQKTPPALFTAFASSLVAMLTAVSAVDDLARTRPRCASSMLSNATVAASALRSGPFHLSGMASRKF